MDSNTRDDDKPAAQTTNHKSSGRKWITKTLILARRVHLYAGLFLLPWVFLYGITGAMFNHQELFGDVTAYDVPPRPIEESMQDFPEEESLARAVVAAMREKAPDSKIELAERHEAAFNNQLIFKVQHEGKQHNVFIDPVQKNARIRVMPENPEKAEVLLPDLKNVKLPENPYQLARESAGVAMRAAGFETNATANPLGWCKLNFLAEVDGKPAQVTYVLRDGHVDTVAYSGEDGMSPRSFFMQLHVSHGQPPYWNARMWWSLILDTMAIAMVTWGVTGLVMWWQLKRTRRIGAVVLLVSVATAAWLYFGMMHFYATTRL